MSNYEASSYGSILGSYSGTYNSTYEIVLPSGALYITDFILAEKDAPVSNNNGGSNNGGSFSCISQLWDCGQEWSECSDGSQTRACISNCAISRTETQSCVAEDSISEISLEDEDADVVEPNGFFSAITGAVVGGGTGSVIAASLFLVLVVGGLVVVMRKKKVKK